MRHAILGAGGVGLVLGLRLAAAGEDVQLVLTPGSLERYQGMVRWESPWRPPISVPIAADDVVRAPADVVWVTVGTQDLEDALDRVRTRPTMVVALLNGLRHARRLRAVFGARAVAGAIRVEAERLAVGLVRQHSLFAGVTLPARTDHSALLELLRACLVGAGLGCTVAGDETHILWDKLSVVLPLGLATTAVGGPLGEVRADARLARLMLEAAREICACAAAAGSPIDVEEPLQALRRAPARTTSSMQRAAAAGRASELPFLTADVRDVAARTGIVLPAVDELVAVATAAPPSAGREHEQPRVRRAEREAPLDHQT